MQRGFSELILIAQVGGGFTIDANYFNHDDLILIAQAAGKGGARIHILNVSSKTQDELIEIAQAGKGAVVFQDL